ncbi:MAG: ATP-binding protein [Gallionella sp.]|nr:ATP-binding protein [Gallionella sp.]MDD4960124.1 ATP-binding protein [Gallionella sp.]
MRIVDKVPEEMDFLRPIEHWRSLFYFNLYRLTLAGLMIFLATHLSENWSISNRHPILFANASITYLTLVIASLVAMWFRFPRFNWQLAGQIISDIVLLSVISYASGGIQSNLGLLLLISLTSAGLISHGKITLFFAAIASIGMLLAHGLAVLYNEASSTQFVQVGLLCMSYFAVAWLAHILAKYAVDSQQLAQQRGQDLVSMSEANRLVMRDMQGGVLVVDEQGEIVQMNPCAERLLHRAAQKGASLANMFPLLYDQYALWKNCGMSSRETLQLDVGIQARLRFVAISPDEARGAVIFLEDMQQVRAEAQQIKLAALGRLTVNIAHEVRNPLSAISHATELLQEDNMSEQQKRLLHIVMDNTQRINQIVHDVMQLNRRDRAQPEILDLAVLLQNFIEEFAQTEKLATGVCILESASPCYVTFDRGHLNQILWNLCRNGLRHGQRKMGSLSLVTKPHDHQVALLIQDDGKGVSKDDEARLFEPFFTTSTEGTGLGLYIAKELCDANNAQLGYISNQGQSGACFSIIFGELHEPNESNEPSN